MLCECSSLAADSSWAGAGERRPFLALLANGKKGRRGTVTQPQPRELWVLVPQVLLHPQRIFLPVGPHIGLPQPRPGSLLPESHSSCACANIMDAHHLGLKVCVEGGTLGVTSKRQREGAALGELSCKLRTFRVPGRYYERASLQVCSMCPNCEAWYQI